MSQGPGELDFAGALQKFQKDVNDPHQKILDLNRQIEKLVQERGVIKEVALRRVGLPNGGGGALRAACW